MIIKSNYPINEEALKDFQNLTVEYDILNSIEVKYNDRQNKQYLTELKQILLNFQLTHY